jgi:hypothetical protein
MSLSQAEISLRHPVTVAESYPTGRPSDRTLPVEPRWHWSCACGAGSNGRTFRSKLLVQEMALTHHLDPTRMLSGENET